MAHKSHQKIVSRFLASICPELSSEDSLYILYDVYAHFKRFVTMKKGVKLT